MIRGALISLVLAGPAFAQELRTAPSYYTNTIFAVTMAEALAQGCQALGLNFFAVQSQLEMLEARLGEDGFDTDEPFDQMIDPTPIFASMQQDFLVKHPIEGAPQAEVCAAGQTEMDEETLIGRLLISEESVQ
ncbi:DUF5333 family protein [Dinoroseobacter sp. S76]|uniref:DUF5333 family protein n=1 Tax=Dinoroseobacter sp. S76 TaxID=3415124 RepID=UPI003C7EC0BC